MIVTHIYIVRENHAQLEYILKNLYNQRKHDSKKGENRRKRRKQEQGIAVYLREFIQQEHENKKRREKEKTGEKGKKQENKRSFYNQDLTFGVI